MFPALGIKDVRADRLRKTEDPRSWKQRAAAADLHHGVK
jgi:hypothetical protein